MKLDVGVEEEMKRLRRTVQEHKVQAKARLLTLSLTSKAANLVSAAKGRASSPVRSTFARLRENATCLRGS